MQLRSRLLLAAVVASASFAALPAGAASTALKDVMKKMGSLATAGDTDAMVPLFAQTKGLKPNDPDYADWDALVEKGRAAAAKGDLAGAKESCKQCHDAHKSAYKTKYGSKAP
jgi:hypothetical protein